MVSPYRELYADIQEGLAKTIDLMVQRTQKGFLKVTHRDLR